MELFRKIYGKSRKIYGIVPWDFVPLFYGTTKNSSGKDAAGTFFNMFRKIWIATKMFRKIYGKFRKIYAIILRNRYK